MCDTAFDEDPGEGAVSCTTHCGEARGIKTIPKANSANF
jgi:hypothetical protein